MKKEQVLDELLLLQFRSGKKESLELLSKRWYPRLSRQIYWHIRDQDAVADIVQETWYAILKGIPTLKDYQRFGVWASRIAYFKSADWIRQHQKKRNIEASLDEDISEIMPQNEEKGNEKITLLRKVMTTLPDDQRSVLAMFYLEAYSIREIAEILNIPKNTVKSRLFQAREKLKVSVKKLTYEKK